MKLKHSCRFLKFTGLTLPEILVALLVFSTAMLGIYFAMAGVRQTLATGVKRNIEASGVNLKIAEMNPANPRLESGYDITTKTQYTLPNGDSFWYTRLVDSDITTPDVKRVNFYLYRSQTSSTPFRTVRREMPVNFTGLLMGQNDTYYKDALGRVWTGTHQANSVVTYDSGSVSGSRQNGFSAGNTPTIVPQGGYCSGVNAPNGGSDASLYSSLLEASSLSNTLEFRFLATLGKEYRLRLGTYELGDVAVAAGNRLMSVTINGVASTETLDAFAEGGANCVAVEHTYEASPVDAGSGMGTITVVVGMVGGGATVRPRLAYLALEAK